jgi:L-threonylcarbamoyladenylate synthase
MIPNVQVGKPDYSCFQPPVFSNIPYPLVTEQSLFLKAIDIIRDGGLVIAPTENFYSIIGDAWSQKAVRRLVQLKGWDYGKPIPLLAGSVRVVRNASRNIPPIFIDLAKEFWPGPLIVVLGADNGFPNGITGGTQSVAIRVPGQSPALDLAKFYRRPLMATDANFNGYDGPRCVKEISTELADEVDLVIDGGWTRGILPTTVLNLLPEQPVMIRSGLLGQRVESFLAERSWRMRI